MDTIRISSKFMKSESESDSDSESESDSDIKNKKKSRSEKITESIITDLHKKHMKQEIAKKNTFNNIKRKEKKAKRSKEDAKIKRNKERSYYEEKDDSYGSAGAGAGAGGAGKDYGEIAEIIKTRIKLLTLLELNTTEDNDFEIKKAYKRLALKYHPDKNIISGIDTTEQFKSINDAYHRLMCIYIDD